MDISAAALVPIAISEFGFEYHHVRKLNLDQLTEFVSSLSGRISTVDKAERDYVMMTKWLPS